MAKVRGGAGLEGAWEGRVVWKVEWSRAGEGKGGSELVLPDSAVPMENKSAVICARDADHGLGRECGLFAQREIRSALSVEAETVSPASVRAERRTVARKMRKRDWDGAHNGRKVGG